MLRPVKKVATNQQVLSSLKAFLEHEQLEVGSRLPSERKLAEMLNVSRSSVREVISALSFLGVVKSKQGDGTYLIASLRKLLSQPDHLFTLQESLDLVEVAEVRSGIEPFVASLAAERATTQDFRKIGKHLEIMRHYSMKDREHFWNSDLQFHLGIASACGNPVMKRMMSAVLENFRQYFEIVRQKYQDDLAEVVAIHEKIYESLRHRDKDQAYTAMTQHMLLSQRITTGWVQEVHAPSQKNPGPRNGRRKEFRFS